MPQRRRRAGDLGQLPPVRGREDRPATHGALAVLGAHRRTADAPHDEDVEQVPARVGALREELLVQVAQLRLAGVRLTILVDLLRVLRLV